MDSEVKSNRNSDVKCHKGFQYVFDKLIYNDTTKSYRCLRRDINCKGRIHVTPGEIRVVNGHSGHDESPTNLEVSIIYFLIFRLWAIRPQFPAPEAKVLTLYFYSFIRILTRYFRRKDYSSILQIYTLPVNDKIEIFFILPFIK